MDLLRGKRLSKMDKRAEQFTSSVTEDNPLIKATQTINKAHILALYEAGILSRDKAVKILRALEKISDIKLDPSLEDVHMNIEALVSKVAGKDGGYMNLGKSRNDQVSAALRIRAREELLSVLDEVMNTIKIMLDRSEEFEDSPLPGYTHMQVAQPVTLSHFLLCYAEALIRGCQRVIDCYKRINISPMGAAALAGSIVPISRESVATLLGFDGIIQNSMDAVSSRDFLVELLSSYLMIQLDLSRISEDLIFYSSIEASYITIPDSYSSTSSIMPQKKNAVALEMVRAKTASIIGMFTAAVTTLKSLPQSYNLDVQEINSLIWKSSQTVKDSLAMVAGVVAGISFNEEKALEGLKYGFAVATDIAESLSLTFDIPFRDAHHIVGGIASRLTKEYSEQSLIPMIESEAKNYGYKVEGSKLKNIMDIHALLVKKKTEGSPNPVHTRRMRNSMREAVQGIRKWMNDVQKSVRASEHLLENKIRELERR
ncbi:MAG: argininosuccinate lyase [Conexivisphaerales archaeon]